MKSGIKSPLRSSLALLLCMSAQTVMAQQLATRFSCSMVRHEDTGLVTYADSGEIRLNGVRIEAFRWESALYRRTHGFDCSIDEADGLQADLQVGGWRVSLDDARAARARRGFDFEHGFNCSVQLERANDTLQVIPDCPALCGSRANFSALSVDLKTGVCHYK